MPNTPDSPPSGDTSPPPDSAPGTVRYAPLALGGFLLFAFFRLDAVFGFSARFGPQLAYVSPGESSFWVAHLLLALPGCALIAYGVSVPLAGFLLSTLAAFEKLDARGRRVAAGTFGILLFALAHVGRQALLRDLPVTDDENSVLFGARMLAHGDLHVPLLLPHGAYTDLFTYVRDGRVSSIDFPGSLFFRALSLVTGLDALLYAFAAATAGVAVVATALRLTNMRGALFAALVWTCSPMVLCLSLTTHTHIVSRCFLALAVFFVVDVLESTERKPRDASALALGAFAGAAFLTRPIEVGMLLAPLGLLIAARAVRGVEGYRRKVSLALLGLLPALCVFGWYNHEITGNVLVQARFGAGVRSSYGGPSLSVWDRIPGNLCFETLMLSVWFLGPIGAALVWLGVSRDNPIAVALASGVGLALSITLAHEYTGVHVVGPIHFSDAPVLLTPLAVLGVQRAFAWLRQKGVEGARSAAIVAATIVLAYGAFDIFHARALESQAAVQAFPFEELARRDIHHAVVLADPIAKLYVHHQTGSWVLQFPHPDPYLRDDIVFANADADVGALRARFPTRTLYRLSISTEPPGLDISRLPP